MSIYQGQITGSLKVQSSLTGLLYATSGVVSAVGLGVANGVASLDSNGRLPISQLSTSAMEIKGDWDASLNSPSLANGTGNMGDVYRCSVAGSVNFGAGSVTFIVGDLVYYTGSVWQIIANSFNLTTSGSNGSASLTGRILNIPTYTLTGLGGVASTRSLTINGTAYDLSADRSWNIPSSPQARTVTTQTATLNQQVFTVSYTSGQIDVYYNGSYLAPSDYTATNGTSVTLAFQCKANDVLVFAAYTNTLTIGGSGVSNYMAKWNSSSLLTSSTILYDTGSLLFVNKSTDNSSGAVLQVNGYITQSTLSAILKADSSGKIVAVTSGDFSSFGFLTGTGTTNTLTKYTGTSTIGNSNISDNGSLITLASNSYISGALGIGSTPIGSSANLHVDASMTGATTVYGINMQGTVQSDVTGNAYYYQSNSRTQATTFTLSALHLFYATQGTFGSGSTVTNQYGFTAGVSLIGATNNYGYYGNIPSGTGRWNIYMAGNANNYMAGSLGIGSTSLTGFGLRVSKNITGATSANSIRNDGAIQSDVTGTAVMYNSVASTAAATYTTVGIVHYYAQQGTIGAGNTVSAQYGFLAEATMIGAGSNFGFYGNIPASAGRWNLYMGGTAANYMAGTLNIGSTGLGGTNFSLNKTITGGWLSSATYGVNMYSAGAVQSDVTAFAYYFVTRPSTQATAFTLNTLASYAADVASVGAGSAITNLHGFLVLPNHIGATNNYAFTGQIAAGSSAWNLYMSGTANNYMAGALGIGTTTLTGYTLRLANNITGSTSSYAIRNTGVVQSDVTSIAYGISNTAQTAAAAFTLGTYYGFSAIQGTIGAGSAITNNIAYYVDATYIGGTNNFGFYGNIASGTNRWNLYMNGTAYNYLGGRLGIGLTTASSTNVGVNLAITGSTISNGIYQFGTVQSDVTSSAYGFRNIINTAASAFTLGTYSHFASIGGTIGAGSTVTTQIGFVVEATMTGATNNYGYYGTLASAANTWNLYMAGTAANYMAGVLNIGTTTLSGFSLDVNGTARVSGQITTNAGNNVLAFSATGSSSYVNITPSNITSKIDLNSQGITATLSVTANTYYEFRTSSNGSTLRLGTTSANGGGIEYYASVNGAQGYHKWFFNNVETMRLQNSQLVVGDGSVDGSAQLQANSNTKGFLPPRGTNAQRTAITSPAVGLIFYCTDSVEGLYIYTSSGWKSLTMV